MIRITIALILILTFPTQASSIDAPLDGYGDVEKVYENSNEPLINEVSEDSFLDTIVKAKDIARFSEEFSKLDENRAVMLRMYFKINCSEQKVEKGKVEVYDFKTKELLVVQEKSTIVNNKKQTLDIFCGKASH